MQNNRAYEDDGVPRDHENRKPSREPSVFRINLTPVTDAECENAAQEQTFVRDWIEDHSERTALVVPPGHIAIEPVADGGEQEDHDRGKPLPLEWFAALDALAIINRQGHDHRDHQNPDHGDFVGSRHGKSTILKLDGRCEKVARQLGGPRASNLVITRLAGARAALAE